MQIRILDQINDTIYNEWFELWKSSNSADYVNSPDWFKSVVETYHYKNQKIIMIYDKEQLVAAAGLIGIKRYGINFYLIPPKDFVYDNPFLIDFNNQKILETFCQALNQIGNVFLQNIPFELV